VLQQNPRDVAKVLDSGTRVRSLGSTLPFPRSMLPFPRNECLD